MIQLKAEKNQIAKIKKKKCLPKIVAKEQSKSIKKPWRKNVIYDSIFWKTFKQILLNQPKSNEKACSTLIFLFPNNFFLMQLDFLVFLKITITLLGMKFYTLLLTVFKKKDNKLVF